MAITTLGTNPIPIVSAGQQPVVVYNRDIANAVIFGPDSGIGGGASANSNEYSIIDPLGSIAFDGSQDVYASCLVVGMTANIDVIYGATDIGVSPLLIAEQINAAGIFQVNKSTVITTQPLQNIAGGGGVTIQFGPFPISQQAYEIAFELQSNNAAPTNPFCTFDMQWSDSVSGNVVARERWMMGQQANGSFAVYFGTGPTKGDTLLVTITNQSTSQCILGFFSLVQNSRSLLRDDWRQNTIPNTFGYTSGTYEQHAGILLSTSPSITHGSFATRLLPLYCGTVQVNFTPVGVNPGHFTINDEGANATSAGLTGQTIYNSPTQGTGTTGGNAINPIVTLPRAQCSITMFNDSSTTTGNVSAFVTIQETPA
jgi:hypothetical protein